MSQTVHKYVRIRGLGFIVWPKTETLPHKHIADACKGGALSAGFVVFTPDGRPVCYGRSNSLGINSGKDDSRLLWSQMQEGSK